MKWTVLREVSAQRWLGRTVLVCQQDDPKTQGFFKTSTQVSRRAVGPLEASEYLAFLLGELYGLPMAMTEIAVVNGTTGIISRKARIGPLVNWNQVSDPINQIQDPKELIRMFVFDTWILNIDRNNRNVILYKGPRERKYRFYLIDHTLSLFGALVWKGAPPESPYWKRVYKYNHRNLTGLPEYILENRGVLDEAVLNLQQIPARDIRERVFGVPDAFVGEAEKRAINHLLLRRQQDLKEIITLWALEWVPANSGWGTR